MCEDTVPQQLNYVLFSIVGPAPPSVEFADTSPSQNYASVGTISAKSSLFELKFSMPEDCLGLCSFANFQACLV